jgi:hypothetical protein
MSNIRANGHRAVCNFCNAEAPIAATLPESERAAIDAGFVSFVLNDRAEPRHLCPACFVVVGDWVRRTTTPVNPGVPYR